jgi:hypothetical protein
MLEPLYDALDELWLSTAIGVLVWVPIVLVAWIVGESVIQPSWQTVVVRAGVLCGMDRVGILIGDCVGSSASSTCRMSEGPRIRRLCREPLHVDCARVPAAARAPPSRRPA